MNMTLSTLKKFSSIVSVLVISTIMGMCSTHWLMVWVALEINTLAMCYLMAKESKEEKKSDSTTFLYYLIQVLTSLIIISSASQEMSMMSTSLLTVAVLMKMGAWPLHTWYMKLIQSMNMKEMSMLIIMTWQKILPVVLLSVMSMPNPLIMAVALVATTSLMIPMYNMKPQTSVKSIIALSSLNNNGWLVISALCSMGVFLLLLSLYSMALGSTLSFFKNMKMKNLKMQTKFWVPLLVVCNMGGIPPLTMFWGKIMVMKNMLQFGFPSEMVMLMVVLACVFLYNYMWMPINETTKTSVKTQMSWKPQTNKITQLMCLSSMMGFMIMLTLDLSQSGLSW